MPFTPFGPTRSAALTGLNPSGDATGAADLANIVAAVAATGEAVLNRGAFTINGVIPLASGQAIYGAGSGLTTITQLSTTANGISITGTNLAGCVVRGVALTGPGQGTGTGIGIFAAANGGAAPCYGLRIEDAIIQNWGVDGVQLLNPLISHLDRVRSLTNGRRGFYITTGTTLTATSCAAQTNTERGWYLTNLEASSLISCGSDFNGLGYELHQCQVVALHACDAVNNVAGGGVDGTSFKLTGGNNNSVRNCFVSGNNAIAFWATASEFDSTFDCVWETTPGGSATASIQADVQVTLINPFVTTAMNLTQLNTQITATQSFFNIASTSLLNSRLPGGGNISQGSGVPTKPFGNNPLAGDIFFRTDTPGTANQRMYVCTTGGAAPVWAGIA